MKGLVIYKSRYGATAQYAAWIGEELGLDVIKADKTGGRILEEYDFFILGASVYIGKLLLKNWLDRNSAFLKGKKLFVFQVAGTPPEEEAKRLAYNEASIPAAIRDQCEYFFLPGRMNLSQLSWKDRFLLKMGARLAKEPVEKKNMLAEYDAVHKDNIAAVTAAVQRFLKPEPVASPALQRS